MKNKILGRVLSAASAAALAAGGMAYLPSAQIEASALSGLDAKGIVSQMRVGWNLGNTLDSYDDNLSSSAAPSAFAKAWGNPAPTANQFQAVKNAGFNTVRIPTTWYQHLENRGNGKYHINDEWMAYVKKTVDYAIDRDMFVILNIHHEKFINAGNWNEQTYSEAEAKLTSIWSELAEEFKDYDQHLIFEGMNEPRQTANPNVPEWYGYNGSQDGGYTFQYINRLNAKFVSTVRNQGSSQNRERLLMLPGYCASSDEQLIRAVEIPSGAGNVALSVHAYTPYDFTMNAAGGSKNFNYGDSYDQNLTQMFDYLDRIQKDKGVPIIIGEFSASDFNNTEARARWADAYLSKAKSKGIPCVLWDNNVSGKMDGECHDYLQRATCTWYEASKPVITAMMKVYGVTPNFDGSSVPTSFSWSNTNIGSNWVELYKNQNGLQLDAWGPEAVSNWRNYVNENYDLVLFYESGSEPELVLQGSGASSWNRIANNDDGDTPFKRTFTYSDVTKALQSTGESLSSQNNLYIFATTSSMKVYGLYAVPKNGSGPVVNTPENPTVSYTKGDFKVTLNWNAVNNSEGYGIYGYTGGTWKLLKEVGSGTTSYSIGNLKSGTNYQVAVLTKYNGKYDNDFSKAITVTPNNVQVTPPSLMVMTNSKTGQFRAEWDKVQGATAYAIAYMPSSATSWKQIASFNTKTFSYTSPSNGRTPKGTYKVAVAAKVGGKWYISDPCQVTIK